MKTSSEFASQFQYIILLILSFFALILWQNNLEKQEVERTAREAGQPNAAIHRPKVSENLDLDHLSPKNMQILQTKYCPKMEAKVERVVEYRLGSELTGWSR